MISIENLFLTDSMYFIELILLFVENHNNLLFFNYNVILYVFSNETNMKQLFSSMCKVSSRLCVGT